MWWKYLLSLLLAAVVAGPCCRAQAGRCSDPAWADSALTHIGQTYSYTTDEWQKACDSLLIACPELAQAWQFKAMPNIKLGNWQQAFGNLQHAAWLDPKTWLPYQAFLKCIFAKDYEGALVDFEACEKLIMGAGVMDHSFDFFRALCYLCMDDLANADAFFKKDAIAQEKSRGKGNLHFVNCLYQGICQLKEHQYLNAELSLRKCIEAYPQYPEANFYLGEVYAQTGKHILAKAYYVKSGQYLAQGYNSSEDQEFYVNYPFAISADDITDALNALP